MSRRPMAVGALLLWALGTAFGVARGAAVTPDTLAAELQALRPAKLVWRDVAWNRCLLDGLSKARTANKPVLLWAFINSDPKEERC